MKISPLRFSRAFERFRALQAERRKRHGWAGPSNASFDEGEDYKWDVCKNAASTLDARKWTVSSCGKGQILGRVLRAIGDPRNNLVYKGPNTPAHSRLLAVERRSEACRELELALFELYAQRRADREVFEALISHCGRTYEVLAFLFFVFDPTQFLPIRTTFFDRALKELGVDLRTEGRCSWDNYQEFLAAMREVQLRLQSEGVLNATLLDAHSFCWVLADPEMPGEKTEEPGPARGELFPGTLLPAPVGGAFTAKDDAQVREMQIEGFKRAAAGEIAEEIALEFERNRLRTAGKLELAASVEDVSLRPGLGYDIRSFETDGRERFIEVKDVSKGSRFFLSVGELNNSRGRPNYWFYLVRWDGKRRPDIEFLEASRLEIKHLEAVQYLVRFSRKS